MRNDVRSEWFDDVDMWPSVHISMYLLITPRPYTGNDLVNYKRLKSMTATVIFWLDG